MTLSACPLWIHGNHSLRNLHSVWQVTETGQRVAEQNEGFKVVRILLQDCPGTISGFLEPAPEEQHGARSTLNGEVVGPQIGSADVFGKGASVVVLGDVGFRELEACLGKLRILLKRVPVFDDRFVVLLFGEI